jgi:hypothetical protein
MHDWFSKTGQGFGSEYRYNSGTGDGDIRGYLDDQHSTTYVQPDGSESVSRPPGLRSYEIRGSANQLLPFGLRRAAT